MRFEIEPSVFELFPEMRIPAVYAEDLDPTADPDGIANEWRRVWSETADTAGQYGNAQSHPRVKPWRERFQAAGFSGKKFPSSIEAMLRRALKNGEPFFINPLVDLYNIVSLKHLVPAGGFDVDELHDVRLDLRVTRDGDTFHALDSNEIEVVPSGEIAYATGDDILTRHFVWRQSKQALLIPNTTRAIFMAEVLGEVGEEAANEVLAHLRSSIETRLNARTESAMLSAGNVCAELRLPGN
jgi:DNA/RNA-binding domain of Phe-tRNA-synthetase-like protein